MEILKLSRKNFKKATEIIIKTLKQGKVLICPTDTIYGLIADATDKKAVEKLFRIKKREERKAIPIFVKDVEMAKRLANINKSQENFLKSVWPGKVTAVLELKTQNSKFKTTAQKLKVYGVNRETIALRIPKYKLILDLLSKLNRPLTATSANISGGKATTKIKEVISQFRNKKNQPDLILDAGNLKKSLPSTIIDLTKNKPRILRKGEKTPKL